MGRLARLLIITIGFTTIPFSVAMADSLCDELWFSRNSIMDQAGYCFSSPLGQAQFDNSDCTGQDVALTPEDADLVNEIQRIEAASNCSVDTGRTTLDISDLTMRERLERQPVRHEGDNNEGWACIGYIGQEITLHAGPNAASAPIGRLNPGDWVVVGRYQNVDGWWYITTHEESWGALVSSGWKPPGQGIHCEAEAG